jgi:synaptotagmin-like protein
MLSIHSQEGGRYGTVAVRGEIEFGMVYSIHSGSLDLSIKQCRDLAAVDTKRSRSDP